MKMRPTIYRTLFALGLSTLLAFAVLAQAGRFAVQLGASPDRAEADAKLKEAQAVGLEAYLVKSTVTGKGIFYRVRIGNYPSRAAAEKQAQQLKEAGKLSEYFIASYEAPEPAAPVVTAAAPKVAPKAEPKPTPTPVVAKATPAPVTPNVAANSGMPAVGTNPNTAPPKTTAKPAATSNSTVITPAPTAPKTVAANPPTNAAATPSKTPAAGGNAALMGGFTLFQDETVGYSFEHPSYWVGGPLGANDMQSQKITGGAMFKSNEDSAFLNAIWNKLDKANSAEHDNDMIVDLILKSMSSGSGTQNMVATSRTVLNEGQQIKTFLDLKAAFQVPNQPSPLDFIGKGVIIRASKGILLVVTFYAKDAPQTVAMTAEHIVKTARTPE